MRRIPARTPVPAHELTHRPRAAVALLIVSVVLGLLLATVVVVALFLAGIALRKALG